MSTAKTLGLILIASEPRRRHSLARSRQKGSGTLRSSLLIQSPDVTKNLRNVYDFRPGRDYCPLWIVGWQYDVVRRSTIAIHHRSPNQSR
jgi:hypothetical protein